MGKSFNDDTVAIERSKHLDSLVRRYLSHHIRNGLSSIHNIAYLGLGKNSNTYQEIVSEISHIVGDLERIGA
jgi:hypothetical protein